MRNLRIKVGENRIKVLSDAGLIVGYLLINLDKDLKNCKIDIITKSQAFETFEIGMS